MMSLGLKREILVHIYFPLIFLNPEWLSLQIHNLYLDDVQQLLIYTWHISEQILLSTGMVESRCLCASSFEQNQITHQPVVCLLWYLEEYRLSTCSVLFKNKNKNFAKASDFYTEIIFVGLVSFLDFRDPFDFQLKQKQWFWSLWDTDKRIREERFLSVVE